MANAMRQIKREEQTLLRMFWNVNRFCIQFVYILLGFFYTISTHYSRSDEYMRDKGNNKYNAHINRKPGKRRHMESEKNTHRYEWQRTAHDLAGQSHINLLLNCFVYQPRTKLINNKCEWNSDHPYAMQPNTFRHHNSSNEIAKIPKKCCNIFLNKKKNT